MKKHTRNFVILLAILLSYTLSVTFAFQYFFTTEKTQVNSSLLITRIGDLGGEVPPRFFKFDEVVDGKDLALFLQCYKGTAPQEAMYLADLGGENPPQFYEYDGIVDGKDLALFLLCYKGLGP